MIVADKMESFNGRLAAAWLFQICEHILLQNAVLTNRLLPIFCHGGILIVCQRVLFWMFYPPCT